MVLCVCYLENENTPVNKKKDSGSDHASFRRENGE